MSTKGARIAELIASCRGGPQNAHYLGYFECFNRGLFFESHEVLEVLWLSQRRESNGPFYQGLIQFAGAFVHLQKDRLDPAARLFRLARANLEAYLPEHENLNLTDLVRIINDWLDHLEAGGCRSNPLRAQKAPELRLEKSTEK